MRKFQSNKFLKIFEFFDIVCVSISDALTDDVVIAIFFQ